MTPSIPQDALAIVHAAFSAANDTVASRLCRLPNAWETALDQAFIETLAEFFEVEDVKEFHVDLEAMDNLNNQLIELVLKLANSFKNSTQVKLQNVRKSFLSTFQLIGLDKNVPIHIIDSGDTPSAAKPSGNDNIDDWDL